LLSGVSSLPQSCSRAFILTKIGAVWTSGSGHFRPWSRIAADGSLSPGRRGRYHPRPPQTRTCAIHAFGSSRESFADDVMDAFGAILCHRHSLTEGVHAISSVWLSMSYRGQGLPGACPVPCFPTWSSPRDASLPSFGSQRAWFPALAGTMKALRLPTCASAVAYFVHFRRPRDPSVLCSPLRPRRRRAPGGAEVPSRPRVLDAGHPQFRLTHVDANGISQVSR
jgi:hypothetical protein